MFKKIAIGIGIFLVIGFIYLWIMAPTIIDTIDVQNGTGQFQNEEIEINLMNSAANGELNVIKASNKSTTDYTEYYNYALEGNPEILASHFSIEMPIPEEVLQKFTDPAELKKHVSIVLKMNTPSSMDTENATEVSRRVNTIVDMEAKKVVAMINLSDPSQAVGFRYPAPVHQTEILFLPSAHGFIDWNEIKQLTNYTISYWGFALRYYANMKLIEVSSENFKIHANTSLDTSTILETLTYLESARVIIEDDLKMSFDKILHPMHVEIYDLTPGRNGEFNPGIPGGGILRFNSSFFKQPFSKAIPANLKVLKITCGHELLHLVQEYYRAKGKQSKKAIHWLDEATAVSAEPLFAEDPTYILGEINSNINETQHLYSLLHSSNLPSDIRGDLGYASGYFWMYLSKLKGHSITSKIYKAIGKEKSPIKALSDEINIEEEWLNFWKTVYTNSNYINTGYTYQTTNEVRVEHNNNDQGSLNIDFKLSNSNKNDVTAQNAQSIQFSKQLPNLTAYPIYFIVNPRKANNADLLEGLKNKLQVNLGSKESKLLVYSFVKEKRIWKLKATLNAENPNASFKASDSKNILFLAINHDANTQTLQKRTFDISFTWTMGDVPPPGPTKHPMQKELDELQRWVEYCALQKQPQQQSNKYAQKYFAAKENELKAAIQLVYKQQTYPYNGKNIVPKPENTAKLANNASSSLSKMRMIVTVTKNQKNKASNSLEGKFYQYRLESYQHLVQYLEAVQNGNNTNNNNSNNNTANNNSSTDYNKAFLGTWNVRGDLSGSITIHKNNTMDINLSGSPTCNKTVARTEKETKSQAIQIQESGLPYKIDARTSSKTVGTLCLGEKYVSSSDLYNVYSVNDNLSLLFVFELNQKKARMNYHFFQRKGWINIDCEHISLKVSK
ncbi:MAG: hypothetical protein GY810_12725 [Aureispira sp.]|nr:hypothetical protein [Aureispira sp.]